MSVLGNIIWFLFVGLWDFLVWLFVGGVLCVTIIGIPFGIQCFKIGIFTCFPFGKKVEHSNIGIFSIIFNIIWIFLAGWFLAMANVVLGLMFCITIIGIPFGIQCFKIAFISLIPFGAKVNDI